MDVLHHIIRYQSISISHDDLDNIIMFNCFRCKSPIGQFTGHLSRLVPGEENRKPFLTVMCKEKGCGLKYQFYQVDDDKDSVSTWLSRNPGRTEMFHCPRCKCPVVEYEGKLIRKLPLGEITSLPANVQCPNERCGLVFNLYGFVNSSLG